MPEEADSVGLGEKKQPHGLGQPLALEKWKLGHRPRFEGRCVRLEAFGGSRTKEGVTSGET